VNSSQHDLQQRNISFEKSFFLSNKTYIHPTAIIGSDVILEDNVKIGPFAIIIGNTTIKNGSRVYAHVSIGFPAQDIGTKESLGSIIIGRDCHIREFASIHAPKIPTGLTAIGDNCYIMSYAHIAHDCILENRVTLINNVNLGGHTHVEQNAMVMANSATHQFCRIGRLTALAPYSGIRQDLPPFCLFSGQPAHFYGLNLIGLKRTGFSSDTIHHLKSVTKLFYQDKLPLEKIISLQQTEIWGTSPEVDQFLSFIKNSQRGVSRKGK